VSVVADPEAVSFIAERGGRLYVYADAGGLKHVKTAAPDDPSITFTEVQADGFVMCVEEDIVQPDIWEVRFRRFPFHHVDVLWDGHQPGLATAGERNAFPSYTDILRPSTRPDD
jgi:hypothetical protein